MNAFTNQVAVVTGASAGVGRAIVRALARRGASVGLLAREPERLERTAQEVRALGGRALAIPTDVVNHDAVRSAALQIERELGPISIWVNNASTTIFAPLEAVTPEEFKRVTEVAYLGYVHGTMTALEHMRPRDRGVIVQVGSALAYRGIPLQAAYCGAKHAIVGFTESVRSELIHDASNIAVTMVHLPAVNTPQFDWCESRMSHKPQPVPPIFQPELAAEGVIWAIKNRKRELYVTGTTVRTIMANKLAPALVDRLAAHAGWEGQLTAETDGARASNLFAPVPGDFAAHGRFDERARRFSLQLWASLHRKELFWCSALALGSFALYRSLRAAA